MSERIHLKGFAAARCLKEIRIIEIINPEICIIIICKNLIPEEIILIILISFLTKTN